MHELSPPERAIKRVRGADSPQGVIDDIRRSLAVLRRHWVLVAACVTACVVPAVLYLLLASPTYRATARVLVIQPPGASLKMQNGVPISLTEMGEGDLPNHVMVIRSPLIINRALTSAGIKGLDVADVITNLKVTSPEKTTKILDISYQSSSKHEGTEIVKAVLASYEKFVKDEYQKSNNEVVNLFEKARDDLTIEVSKMEEKYLDFRKANPATVSDEQGHSFFTRRLAQWEQVASQLLLRSLQMKKKLELGKKLVIEGVPPSAIAEALQKIGSDQESALPGADDPGRQRDSYEGVELELSDVTLKRQLAERMVHHLKAQSEARNGSQDNDDQALARVFYSHPQVAPVWDELRRARRDIEKHSKKIRGADPYLDQLRAKVKLSQKDIDELWVRLKPELTAGGLGRYDAESLRQAESDVLVMKAREETLRERRDQLREENLRRHRQDLERTVKVHGPNHAATKKIRDQIARLEGKSEGIDSSKVGAHVALIPSIERSIEAIDSMRTEIQNQFDLDLAASRKADIELLSETNMRNNLERHRALFNTVVDQLRQIHFVSEVGKMNLQTISPPGAAPVRPNLVFVLTLALMAGCALGTAVSFAIELTDTRIRTSAELVHITHLTMLGSVPRMLPGREPAEIGMICQTLPNSAQAECYKSIRTSLEFLRRNKAVQALLISSPDRGDGKSTTASNLAISLAHAGRRVLLIDGDLRSPSQHEIHGMEREPGLSGVLEGQISWREAVRPTTVERLDLLAAGAVPTHPAELLVSERLTSCLVEARHAYDIVIIDSSPLLGVADPSIIAGAVDGMLMVVRASATRRQDAEQALDLLDSLGIPLVGVIVNAIVGERKPYGYTAYALPDPSANQTETPAGTAAGG